MKNKYITNNKNMKWKQSQPRFLISLACKEGENKKEMKHSGENLKEKRNLRRKWWLRLRE